MTTTPTSAPWWRTAPNPPCSSWCEGDHAPDEFTYGGGLLCRRVIHASEVAEVEVQQLHGVEGGSEVITDPANIYISVDSDSYLTPEKAEALASALLTASRTTREANR